MNARASNVRDDAKASATSGSPASGQPAAPDAASASAAPGAPVSAAAAPAGPPAAIALTASSTAGTSASGQPIPHAADSARDFDNPLATVAPTESGAATPPIPETPEDNSATAALPTPTAPAGHGAAPHRVLITITVMLASVMQALDNTIANVALPRIQGSLSASQDQMSWVLTSYIIAAAIMTPLSGWLAGRIGRRRVFLTSIIGFTITSALCGLAQTLPEIVVARLLQGLCGAALVPMSQAILLDINPPEKHGRAMAIWVMAVTIGPILGPALGGWLTENYNWRWVFYINVPFGLLSAFGTLAFISETQPRKSRFDFFGFATLSLAIGAFQMMLDRGQLKDWFNSTEICVTAAIAALSMYLFIVHMLTTKETPFVSAGLFKDRNFLTGSVFIFIVGAVLFAVLALLPPLLQDLMNYPVVLTGMVTAPRGAGTFAAMFLVQWLMRHKLDVRIVIGTGFLITAVSLWMMTGFYLQMDQSMVVWSGLLQGLGAGMVYVPLAAVTFTTLAPALRNEGTAIFSLMRNIGSSIGISIVTALLTRNTQIMHSRLAENVTPYFNPWHPTPALTAAGAEMVNHTVTSQAAMIAYNNDFKMMLILALVAAPAVVLLRISKKTAADDAPVVVE